MEKKYILECLLIFFVAIMMITEIINQYNEIPEEVSKKAKYICGQHEAMLNGITRSIIHRDTWYANCNDKSAITYTIKYDTNLGADE